MKTLYRQTAGDARNHENQPSWIITLVSVDSPMGTINQCWLETGHGLWLVGWNHWDESHAIEMAVHLVDQLVSMNGDGIDDLIERSKGPQF